MLDNPSRGERDDSGFPTDAPIRLFVCAARKCRDAGGGRPLIEALQREIAQAGANVNVKACGCLDRCEKGPAVVAYGGKAARAPRPPHGWLDKLLHRPVATFLRVTAADARRMVTTLMNI